MRKLGGLLTIGALTLGLTTSLAAQEVDISGQWELTRSGGPGGGGGGRGGGGGGGGGGRGGGGGGPLLMEIVQDGNTFTGTLELPFGPSDISDGVIEGTEISFKVAISRQGRSFEMIYTGKIEGDTMSGTATTPRGDSEWSAKRAET